MSSNNFALVTKMLPILDMVYKREAITAPLEVNPDNVSFVNANTVKLMKIALDGLGDYSRSTGFVAGGVQTTWETMTLSKDRGRSFSIDAMDDEESFNMVATKTMSEFLRRKVIPELDAYRFATIAGTANIGGASADVTPGTTDCVGLLDTAEEVMGDKEVPAEGRLLFVSENFYRGMKNDISREWVNENGINRQVLSYNGMRVIRVPMTRFCTGITLYDGSSNNQTDGGYKFTASSSKPINFMIVHPSAITQITKHVVPRLFTPAQNINADAYKIDYRIYHDIFAEANKLDGIYVHKAETAIASNIVG